MPIDPSRTEITLHSDPRLVAAVGAVITHAGQRLGLSGGAQDLSTAAMDVVREIFVRIGDRAGAPEPLVKVIVEDVPGQLRVTIEHSGEAMRAAEEKYVQSLQGFPWDQAAFAASNGTSRVTLTKYTAGKAPQT